MLPPDSPERLTADRPELPTISNYKHKQIMETPPESFTEWRTRHHEELIQDYRQYLRDVLDDDGFDISTVEDFWTWARPEYEALHGMPEHGDESCMYHHDHIAHPEQCEWHD